MTLTREGLRFLGWLRLATAQLLRIDRAATSGLIATIIAHQIATMLAFFLPLKVILLVGSPGIPRYFRFFVSDDTRDTWVVALAVATFVFFLLSQYLDSLIERYSQRGAESLRESADQVPITDDETAATETSYHRIVASSAKLGFAALVLAAGLALYPPLFATLLILMLAEFAVASRAAGDLNSAPASRFGRYVREQSGDLLKLLKSINFLTVFAFLLTAFVAFEGLNLLIAIASIMISRQMFGALGDVVKNGMKLTQDRHRVDALVFPAAQLSEAERQATREFRERYAAGRRLERIAGLVEHRGEASDSAEAEPAGLLGEVAESVWVDSSNARTAIFDLYGSGGVAAGERLLREYVYAPKGAKGLDQHDYLLERLDESALRCLPRVATYEEEGFTGRIIDVRGVDAAGNRAWRDGRPALLRHFWELSPPADLVRSFTSARPLLVDRVPRAFMTRLGVAADEPWARSTHERLTGHLEELCERVRGLPLSLCNHNFDRRNTVQTADGDLRLVSWTSWGLEPVGAGFDPQGDDVHLLSQAAAAADQREEPRAPTPLADVLSAATLYRLERLLEQHRPKQALALAEELLPLLHASDAEIVAVFESRQERIPEPDEADDDADALPDEASAGDDEAREDI